MKYRFAWPLFSSLLLISACRAPEANEPSPEQTSPPVVLFDEDMSSSSDMSSPQDMSPAPADLGVEPDQAEPLEDMPLPVDMPKQPLAIALEVERVDNPNGLDPFDVTVILARGEDAYEGGPPSFIAEEGTVQGPDASLPGRFRYRVTPTHTGEHPFSVSIEDQTLERTALVFQDVDEQLGQPMAVPGLVNTPGYEDGATITPDGRYMFVQTGPHYFSGFIMFGADRDLGGCGGNRLVPERCTHPWFDETIGAYGPPERPGFFTGRIAEDGRLRHNSALYQVPDEGSPILAPITMFYGFERQPDGSFADPFWVAFEDENDAIANPFGLSFQMLGNGEAQILFALNDPSEQSANVTGLDLDGDGAANEAAPSGFDIYTARITLGENNVLGKFVPGALPQQIELESTNSERLDLGDVGEDGIYGTQGNPHLHAGEDGQIASVWTDDEYDTDPSQPSHEDHEDLAVYVLDGTFPEGPWTKVILPDKINTPASQIQPFFLGDGLLYTEDVNLVYVPYSGPQTAAGYADESHWGDPVVLIQKDRDASRMAAIGEPTVAVIDGEILIYFIYGHVRGREPMIAFPDIDMQAGFVRWQP